MPVSLPVGGRVFERFRARQSIGVALFFLSGLLIAEFAVQSFVDWRDFRRSQDISAADHASRDLARAVTDLGVVRGFTATYLSRPEAVAPASIEEMERRYAAGSGGLASARATLAGFRPDLARSVAALADRAGASWQTALRELALPQAARDQAFARSWFDGYTIIINDVERLLVETRSPARLDDMRFALLSDMRVAILRWRLLRTREMGFIGGLVSTGTAGSPGQIPVIEALRNRADAVFAQIELNTSSIRSERLATELRRVALALEPLNQIYAVTREAWRESRPAPIDPLAHDRLTLAAIDAINALLDSISLETQDYASSVAASARRNAAVSFALLLAGLTLSLVAWRLLARTVIGPLENLSDIARRVAGGERAARARPVGAAEAREAIGQFNAMLDTIDRVQHSLERANVDLDASRTEAVRLSAALQKERDFAARLVEVAPVAVMLLDSQGRILAGNPAFEALSGYIVRDLIGEDWFSRFLPEDKAASGRRRFADSLAAGSLSVGSGETVSIVSRSGEQRQVEWRSRIMRGDTETESTVLFVGHDVTERNRLEEQLRQSQRLEAVGQLTGGVAHDFNNLLAVVTGNLELLLEELGDRPDLHELAQRALRSGQRGATLTRSLLAFARKQTLMPQRLNLREVLHDMTDLVRRTTPANITVNAVHAENLWACDADPGQLQNALLNLVINARDAMPDGGALTIETANLHLEDEYAAASGELRLGEYVVLSVSDTGSGMAPEIATRAFEPFFSTKPVGRGTGLGLSMVYGFAKQSGGHARIYSEPGRGTTVRLYLPRSAGAEPARPPRPDALPARAGERVLVVEDDPDLLTLVFALLRSLGYEVEAVADGAAALRVLEDGAGIGVLLTDVVLRGGMDGVQLAARARAADPALRIVFMSGYTEAALLETAGLPPGRHVLHKPFSKEQLAAAIRAALDGG